ncbi:MAG: histidine kinase, partial [Chitinophagaceae bacterium]
MPATSFVHTRKLKDLLIHHRWPWHLAFWIGYACFRFWLYYITVVYYPQVYLEYMLLSELIFAAATYFTLYIYKKLFDKKRYLVYFLASVAVWLLYLYGRTVFQFYYLANAPGFKRNTFIDIFLNNITVVLISFLFITSCKFFKNGFIAQQFETEKQNRQLLAEVENLKSQIAPHFLFNTLNNLYGLAVAKSDKLPDLMLRLSDLLRHSLYETQKPFVMLADELQMLKGYIDLESLRLEESLKLEFDNAAANDRSHHIAPLLLIVFVENAFKHAKLIQTGAIEIYVGAKLEGDWFIFSVRN